jgi:hypothetical protein
MQTLKPKLALLLLFLGSLAAQPPSLGRDEQPIVPMGALAHAAAALEQSTGGRVLEVRPECAGRAGIRGCDCKKGRRVVHAHRGAQ